jgi:hypothetical protein
VGLLGAYAVTALTCVLYTKEQFTEREKYDLAVLAERESSASIRRKLTFLRKKIFDNEKEKKEIDDLKKSKSPKELETDIDFINKESDLLTQNQIFNFEKQMNGLEAQLEKETQKRVAEYKKYEETFTSYGKPTIIHDVSVEKIREYLDKDICDVEKSLKRRSEAKKEEKEKKLDKFQSQNIDTLNEQYNSFKEAIINIPDFHEKNRRLKELDTWYKERYNIYSPSLEQKRRNFSSTSQIHSSMNTLPSSLLPVVPTLSQEPSQSTATSTSTTSAQIITLTSTSTTPAPLVASTPTTVTKIHNR